VALAVMCLVTRGYREGRAWTLDDLTARLMLPGDALGDLLGELQALGFLAETSSENPQYLPARDPSKVAVVGLLAALRQSGEGGYPLDPEALVVAEADRALAQIEGAAADRLSGLTLAELVATEGPAA
jgi:DNA-binding IscR family transcriptional regulator